MEVGNKIRKKQILTVVAGMSTIVFLFIFGVWILDPNKGKPTLRERRLLKESEVKKNYKVDSKTSLSPRERWVSLSERKFADIADKNKELERLTSKLKEEIEELKKSRSGKVIKDSIETKMSSLKKNPPDFETPLPNSKVGLKKIENIKNPNRSYNSFRTSGLSQNNRSNMPGGIEEISLVDDTDLEKKKNNKNIRNFVPAAAFAKAQLLSGADVPTGGLALKNPHPIVLRILKDAQLPNKFKSKIKECHLIGAAHGEISSERGFIRLETMSCVLKNESIIEGAVAGYVAGEDGKAGLRGKIVSKQGSLIAKSALAGLFSGIGSAVSQSYATVSQSPLGSVSSYDPKKIGEMGLTKGASDAFRMIAEFYIARANEIYPIIEIAAGRIGEIVFTKGFDLEKFLDTGDKKNENA